MTTNIEQFLPKFPQEPIGNIKGFVPKYNNNNSINVLPGACMDDTDKVKIEWNLTKNKVLTNPSANTIYNIFAIKNAGSEECDIHLDVDIVSPDLPSGYNYKRWLGWLVTDSVGDIIPCDWIGSGLIVEMWFKSRQTVATGLNQTSYTIQSLAGWIPAGVQCGAFLGGTGNTASARLSLSVDGVNIYSGSYSHNSSNTADDAWGIGFNNPGSFVPILNTQIRYKVSSGVHVLYLKAVRYWR